jgi:hypothetical protein
MLNRWPGLLTSCQFACTAGARLSRACSQLEYNCVAYRNLMCRKSNLHFALIEHRCYHLPVANSEFVPRRAAGAVTDALGDTRVVLVNGARQAGKSTLVRAVAGQRAAEWRDLDAPQDRQSALEDPVGFVAFDGLMVIDEIQRAPELLLAVKARVDADPRPAVPAHWFVAPPRPAGPS